MADTDTHTHTDTDRAAFTDQGVDERVLLSELRLQQSVLAAELLHLLSQLCELLRLQPVDLGGVSLAVGLTLALLPCSP